MRRLRYRRLAVAGGLTAVAVGASVYLLWPVPQRVTWAGLSTVSPGDTRAEVYAKLGGPPGDYRQYGYVGSTPGRPMAYDLTTSETWTCDDGVVHVWFDADGRVKDVIGRPSHDLRPTLLQRVKWKLGL